MTTLQCSSGSSQKAPEPFLGVVRLQSPKEGEVWSLSVFSCVLVALVLCPTEMTILGLGMTFI